jgi:UDP-N-acetylglucosamine 1-carboxyvinyltransferase
MNSAPAFERALPTSRSAATGPLSPTVLSDRIHVTGGTPLTGEVTLRGAKNLVPKAMVAALLGSSPSSLRNIPQISDVRIVTGLLEAHGVTVRPGAHQDELVMDPSSVGHADQAEIAAHAGESRIPILLCGPLLHRIGHAFIPDLGGCRIGDRPIDFHLDALRAFGAVVEKRADGLHLEAPQRLRGTKITLPYPSVGSTEQVLLTAVLAEGVTELRNAATEPEIVDLIAVLQKMGAIISILDNRVIHITGVDKLSGYSHRALPDRLEAASWACAALATGGNILVRGAHQGSMMTFLNTFRRVGGAFEVDDTLSAPGIRFWHPGGPLAALALETDVHPGFQTDWQQPLVVALTQAQGLSIVHETVYEKRLGFTSALVSMGAQIQLYRECLGGTPCRFGQRNFMHSAVISGPTKLYAAELEIPDLRAGFSYLIAALAAQGTSTVHGISLISRGYEDFADKLTALGATFEFGE